MCHDTALLNRHQSEVDAADAQQAAVEAAQVQAKVVVLKALQAATPVTWFKNQRIGGVYISPDDMLITALADSKSGLQDALGALLASPVANALHEALATYYEDNYYGDVLNA